MRANIKIIRIFLINTSGRETTASKYWGISDFKIYLFYHKTLLPPLEIQLLCKRKIGFLLSSAQSWRLQEAKLPQQCKRRLPRVQAHSSASQPAACPSTGDWEAFKRQKAWFGDPQYYCGSQFSSGLPRSISGNRSNLLSE